MRHFLAASLVVFLLSSTSRAAELKTDIEYGRVGETRLLLDATLPDGPGPFPAVIVLHGGGWSSGDKQADAAPLLRALSAINHIAPGAKLPPFLLVHGTVDKTVPFVQSIAFQKRLRDTGATCDLVAVENAPHRLSEWEKIDSTYKDKMTNWLKKTL